MNCRSIMAIVTSFVILSLTFFCHIDFSASAETTTAQENSVIAQYLRVYDSAFPNDGIKQAQVLFEPCSVTCGTVQVTFDEILYDGQWMYTAVSAEPLESSVIILPGDAEPSDPVAGFYGEKARKDSRSFIDAAKEDGKQLVAVYAYMKEFDAVGTYFLDHLQIAESSSLLYSGTRLGYGNITANVNWLILTYDIDLETGKYTLQCEGMFPVTIEPMQPYKEQSYKTDDGEALTEVSLVQTPLNTYIIPQWNDDSSKSSFSVVLQSADDIPVQQSSPFDAYAYDLDILPQQITVGLINHETEQRKQLIFTAVE